jgi:hypothetical protein
MPDQPERTPHIRITRSSITVQGSPAEQPRTFARHIECSGEQGAERKAAGGGRGENMRYREGEDRGRRRSS